MIIQEHTKEEVEQIITPYISLMRECVLEAWERWRESDHARHLHWKTVAGNNMCNYFLEVAIHKFHATSSHIHVSTKFPHVGLFVESMLYIRFKKGSSSLRTSNVQTKSIRAFHDKSMFMETLDGLTRLELVYVPTRDFLDVERIMLVSKDKGRVSWTIDLLAQIEPEQKIFEFPQQPHILPGSTAKRVVKKKDGVIDERKQQSAGKGS